MNLKIDAQKDLLSVEVTGEIRLEEAKIRVEEILSVACQNKIARIFVDTSPAAGVLTPVERVEFAKHLAQMVIVAVATGRLQSPRVVIFGKFPVIDNSKLGETVANNRGVSLKVTTDRQDAMAFLGMTGADVINFS